MNNLLEFSKNVQNILDESESNFAKDFIKFKCECYHKYQNGLVQSGSHGIDFFKNIILYWNDPDSYPLPKEKKGREYEENFVKMLKNNR